jgi:hypothetical protein
MKPSDIKVGRTYVNRGKGTTSRKVWEIGNEYRPRRWFGGYTNPIPPDEPGILYLQIGGQRDGHSGRLYLSSFAAWCGKEVED